jgi:DNA transposition AAA+ family ATPase
MGRGGDPDAMQHLLSRAKWDADAVRDDLRVSVVEHLNDDQAVLVVDESARGTYYGLDERMRTTSGRSLLC